MLPYETPFKVWYLYIKAEHGVMGNGVDTELDIDYSIITVKAKTLAGAARRLNSWLYANYGYAPNYQFFGKFEAYNPNNLTPTID